MPSKGRTPSGNGCHAPSCWFAAAFNPLVYHPSFEGLHERRWGISSPGFRFSEWNEPRIYGPVLQEDAIPLGDYKWIEIEPEPGPPFPSFLHVTVENPDTESHVRLMAVGNSGEPIPGSRNHTCKIAGSVVDRITSEYEGAPDAKARMFGKSGKLTRVDIDLQTVCRANAAAQAGLFRLEVHSATCGAQLRPIAPTIGPGTKKRVLP